MSERPTPETDAASWVETNEANALTLASFSRQLERQRDEARDQLIRICREGFGDQDTISLEPCADYALRKLKEEREELLKLRVENDHNRQAVADLEKIIELAREQIAKANSERENDTQSELAAWELLKQTRELARELRDVLESAEAMLCKQETELRSLGADEPCAECAILDSRLALAKAKEVIP